MYGLETDEGMEIGEYPTYEVLTKNKSICLACSPLSMYLTCEATIADDVTKSTVLSYVQRQSILSSIQDGLKLMSKADKLIIILQ